MITFPEPDRSSLRSRKEVEQSVYLGRNYYEVTVSQEGYAYIAWLVQQYSICHTCKQYYCPPENPNVAGNLCLSCFLQVYSSLKYQGPLDIPPEPQHYRLEPYPPQEYLFLDDEGYVYTTKSGPGQQENTHADKRASAHYWRFVLPEKADHNGKTVALQQCTCTLYGDLRGGEVILVHFAQPDITFILRRGEQAPAIQLSRRKEMHRRVLAAAREELEATKQPNGKYLIGGEEAYSIHSSDVYRLIAAKINQEITANRSSQEPAAPEEEQPEPEADETAQP